MSDDILDAIDRAVGCQHCGEPLADSPSDDFCSEYCAEDWHENRVEPLPQTFSDFAVNLRINTEAFRASMSRASAAINAFAANFAKAFLGAWPKAKTDNPWSRPRSLGIDGHAYHRRTRARRASRR